MAIVERSDLTTLSLTSGGSANLIHPEFAADIIKSAAESSLALRTFQTRRVPTGQLSIPVLSALPSAFWVAESPLTGTAAATSVTRKGTTEPGWKNVVLKLAELAAMVPIPLAVLEDAAGTGYDLWSEIRPYVGQAIASKIDESVFFGGTGAHVQPAGWAAGIVTQAIAVGNTHAVGTDLPGAAGAALGDVEATGFEPDQWYAGRSFRGNLRSIKDTTGTPVYLTGGWRSDNQTDELYGIGITYNRTWDQTVALSVVGDSEAAIMGVSLEGMRVDYLKEASIDVSPALDGSSVINLAQQNMVALRISLRTAFATASPVVIGGNGKIPFSVVTP